MEEEMGRKRKNGENDDDPLALTLSPPLSRPKPTSAPPSSPPPPPPPPPSPPVVAFLSPVSTAFTPPAPPPVGPVPRAPRLRRNQTHESRKGKSDKVEPPFPWSTDHRATVHTLEHLLSNGIDKISGEVQCKRCEGRETISYDLLTKFREIRNFVVARKHTMHDRAPPVWSNPEFLGCRTCAQANCMKPVVAQKKRKINWLFMLLGQTLGCCTLEQLKYFCKHTKNHRTGAKDRVLYLTYLGLGKQLDPTGPFDVGH